MRRLLLALALLPIVALAGDDSGYVTLPGGTFRSALRYEDTGGQVKLAPFALQRRPVTNAEFAAFVASHPQWRRDRVAVMFAEVGYLRHWPESARFSEGAARQPVVNVSWFAAQAYCEAQGARLPTWNEWEYAAAADATRFDARSDPVWRESILGWYSRPSNAPLADVGMTPTNAYGVQDLHGLIWEWVDDAAGMLVSGDNRNQQDPDRLKFCGAGALSVDDRENYAVLMRVAMLSSLSADDATGNLGFRCAKSMP